MILKKLLLLISLYLCLASCSSNQQTTFYLLRAMEPTKVESKRSRMAEADITVLVNPVKFPIYLDQPQMVVRESNYKFSLSENHRWIQPLKDDFTRIIVENINTRITPDKAAVYSELEGAKPSHQLFIEVLQMDINTTGKVILKVKWSIAKAINLNPIKKQVSVYSIVAKDLDHESAVEAQSIAIAQFADYIAENIQSLPDLSSPP